MTQSWNNLKRELFAKHPLCELCKIRPAVHLHHAVINKGKATNIEVNFYSGTGSKPSEIISSYSDRNRELKSAGWKFVWLTDGMGWRKMQRPLRVGIENISFVINAHLLRKGLLENIISDD